VAEFMSLLKVVAVCATGFFLAMLVLLALPKSRLRSVGIECLKYALAAGCALLVVGPDLMPFIPLDDIAYGLGGWAAVRSARADRKRRLLEEECDASNAAFMARFTDAPGERAPGGGR
jgi:hypothetical protein